MKTIIALALLFLSSFTQAEVERYDKPRVREKLLAIVKGLPAQNLRIQGQAGTREAAFAEFYAKEVHPALDGYLRLQQRHSALKVLIDSGSYLNKEELAEWKIWLDKLSDEISALAVDPHFHRLMALWGERAEGLSGELAAYARAYSKELALEHFPEEMRDTLTEVDRLGQDFKAAIIGAPSAAGIKEWSKYSVEIPRLYKSGLLTFAEAQARLTDLNQRVGGRFVGYEAVQAQGAALNRMAILRTRLAQSKGYRTWAEYQLDASGQGYTEEYRGVANQRAFLHAWIEQMRPVVQDFVARRARELGIDPSSIRRPHMSLLTLPGLELAQPYFPANRLTRMWERVMLASGFKPETLAQIIFDDEERIGTKNPTMAYMAPLLTPRAETRVLDAGSLNFLPSNDIRRGQIYILQTFRGAGLSDLRTAFHEGMGHALEYLLKDKEDLTSEGYGYVEVPSTTAEYFMRDARWLNELAVPVDGRKPSLNQFREWATNTEKNDGVALLARAGSALYDLDLWDYDFTQEGALSYVERAQQVYQEMEARTGQLPTVDAKIPAFYAQMSSTHFTSGNVRNIGYSYASLGAEMMAQFLSRELQRRTGRSDWYHQPGLADLITESFYKKGWREPFPLNVEKITGRKFDREKILADLTKSLGCNGDLR